MIGLNISKIKKITAKINTIEIKSDTKLINNPNYFFLLNRICYFIIQT